MLILSDCNFIKRDERFLQDSQLSPQNIKKKKKKLTKSIAHNYKCLSVVFPLKLCPFLEDDFKGFW